MTEEQPKVSENIAELWARRLLEEMNDPHRRRTSRVDRFRMRVAGALRSVAGWVDGRWWVE